MTPHTVSLGSTYHCVHAVMACDEAFRADAVANPVAAAPARIRRSIVAFEPTRSLANGARPEVVVSQSYQQRMWRRPRGNTPESARSRALRATQGDATLFRATAVPMTASESRIVPRPVHANRRTSRTCRGPQPCVCVAGVHAVVVGLQPPTHKGGRRLSTTSCSHSSVSTVCKSRSELRVTYGV